MLNFELFFSYYISLYRIYNYRLLIKIENVHAYDYGAVIRASLILILLLKELEELKNFDNSPMV